MPEIREPLTLENQGQKIFAVVHRPAKGEGPFPTIICCHGFAGDKIGRFRFYVDFAKTMAEQGYVVVRFDFRGSGDSEGTLEEMTISGEVSDTLVVLEHVSRFSFVDKKRMGLLGRSMGGLVSVLAATEWDAPIRSLCLWAPVFRSDDWKERVQKAQDPTLSPEERGKLSRVNGQTPSFAFLQEFFQIKLDQILPQLHAIPLLHIHGEQDSTVTLVHAEGYKKVREQASAESRFLRLPQSDHAFSDTKERRQALATTCTWFLETL